MHETKIDRFLRYHEVTSCTGKKKSTLYNDVRKGLFPRPVQLGPRAVAWPASEIAALNRARLRGATDEEIRSLVADLEAARGAA